VTVASLVTLADALSHSRDPLEINLEGHHVVICMLNKLYYTSSAVQHKRHDAGAEHVAET